jgi:hypothetical protein
MLPADTRPSARAHGSGSVQVWVKIANHWRAAFASDDRNEARQFSNEQIRHGGAVERIELRDMAGMAEPIFDMTWGLS